MSRFITTHPWEETVRGFIKAGKLKSSPLRTQAGGRQTIITEKIMAVSGPQHPALGRSY